MTHPVRMSHKRQQELETVVVPDAKTERRLSRPRLYKVLLHNDDFTTMEFVVAVLRDIFHRSEAEANAIMLHVHQMGIGVAGVFTKEVAECKVAEVTRAAEEAEFPLLSTMEPEDSSEEPKDPKERDENGP